MTPQQLSKSGSEHGHQVAFFAYCAIALLHGFEVADFWATYGQLPIGLEGGKYNSKPIPALKWIHAIHNQGHGDAVRGAKAKAEGVKAGVADIFFPYRKYLSEWNANNSIPGLYIEMKKPSEKPKKETSMGGVSDAQKEFAMFVENQGYQWNVCYSWQEAVAVLKEYLS